MEKGITYNEKELKEKFEQLAQYIEQIKTGYGTMYQKIWDNKVKFDKRDLSSNYLNLVRIIEILNSFNIQENIPEQSIEQIVIDINEGRKKLPENNLMDPRKCLDD